MPPRGSLLVRGLEPLVAGLWIVFVLVSLVVGAVWVFQIGEGSLKGVPNSDLRATLVWLLAHGDLGWFTLAAVNVYVGLTTSIRLDTARQWALLILGTVIIFSWASVGIGFPLGQIRYGPALGMKLGPVPLGLLLLWFSIIIGAREGLLLVFPQLGQMALAIGTGLLALLTDLSLEPAAAQWRGFWFWLPKVPTDPPVFHPPAFSCVAWGLLAGLITLLLREPNVVDSARKRSWHPAATFAILNAVFLAAHVGYKLRS